MSSTAAPPEAARTRPRPALGAVALGLALGVLVAGIAALAVDEGAYHGDPFAIQLWPVHPLWIVVPTGIGLTIALVLAVCAILLKRGKTPAVVAVAIGALPEVLIVLTLVAVVGNELT